MKTSNIFNIILTFCLIIPYPNWAQETDKFRVDCKWVSVYDKTTEKWGEWEEGDNTFIFNYNEGKDIKVYYASGKSLLFRNLGNKDEGKLDDGTTYQSLMVLAEHGEEALLVLYSHNLVVLFYENAWIRFSPK